MSFILARERDSECIEAFRRYREYLSENSTHFPKSAFDLATAEWYFYPHDHRCPHDAWMESISIIETGSGDRNKQRLTTIKVRLLGAYHDGHIELTYPVVFAYELNSPSSERGLGDWRYDEFRIRTGGGVIHEIEWAGFGQIPPSRWQIESSDVKYQWIPLCLPR